MIYYKTGVMNPMKKYKPIFLGSIIPADNESKLTEFVQKKFNAFNDIYDVCKNHSEDIDSITNISNNSEELSVKVICSAEVMEDIKEKNTNEKLTVNEDVVTAQCV